MALPSLPSLPSLAERPTLTHRSASPLQILSPSGDGWGFSPDGGWGIDSSGFGFGGSGFTINPGGGTGGSTGGGFDLWNNLGGIVGGAITGATGGSVNGPAVANTGAAAINWFSGINWGRIGAFLLGLLLIAGGLYLIKPLQQIVNTTVVRGGRALAESTAEAA